MITYFSFEPAKNLYTDFKGRPIIPGEAVYSKDNSDLIVKPAYAVATSNGWKLLNQNDYGMDVDNLIQNELASVCAEAIASF